MTHIRNSQLFLSLDTDNNSSDQQEEIFLSLSRIFSPPTKILQNWITEKQKQGLIEGDIWDSTLWCMHSLGSYGWHRKRTRHGNCCKFVNVNNKWKRKFLRIPEQIDIEKNPLVQKMSFSNIWPTDPIIMETTQGNMLNCSRHSYPLCWAFIWMSSRAILWSCGHIFRATHYI